METILRGTLAFFFIWGLLRALGKRELSEMTAFELVLLVTMGDLIQQGITQEDMSVTGAFLAVGTIGFWSLVFSYVSFRWKAAQPVLEGRPVLIIKDGMVLEEVLHVERLTKTEVLKAVRAQGIDDLSTIEVGILEADGKFSFLNGIRQNKDQERQMK